MNKNILGHINCPTCGTAGAMQITHDKNGHPFGFCAQECGQQLRVGPNPDRIAEFVKRYPFAGTAKAAAPVPAPAPAAAKLAPVPAPAPAAKKAATAAPRSSMADALAFLGVKTA